MRRRSGRSARVGERERRLGRTPHYWLRASNYLHRDLKHTPQFNLLPECLYYMTSRTQSEEAPPARDRGGQSLPPAIPPTTLNPTPVRWQNRPWKSNPQVRHAWESAKNTSRISSDQRQGELMVIRGPPLTKSIGSAVGIGVLIGVLINRKSNVDSQPASPAC